MTINSFIFFFQEREFRQIKLLPDILILQKRLVRKFQNASDQIVVSIGEFIEKQTGTTVIWTMTRSNFASRYIYCICALWAFPNLELLNDKAGDFLYMCGVKPTMNLSFLQVLYLKPDISYSSVL